MSFFGDYFIWENVFSSSISSGRLTPTRVRVMWHELEKVRDWRSSCLPKGHLGLNFKISIKTRRNKTINYCISMAKIKSKDKLFQLLRKCFFFVYYCCVNSALIMSFLCFVIHCCRVFRKGRITFCYPLLCQNGEPELKELWSASDLIRCRRVCWCGCSTSVAHQWRSNAPLSSNFWWTGRQWHGRVEARVQLHWHWKWQSTFIQ